MMASNYLPSLKCCIVGSCGVGKTSIIQKYLRKNNNNTETTLGAIFWTLLHKTPEDTPYKIDFWDTAGQERYSSLIPMYSRNSDIMIVAFDIADRNSFLDLDKWLHTLSENSNYSKYILVGNKCDMELFRQVYESDVKNFLMKNKKLNMKYFETSATLGTNINNLFDFIFELGNTKINSNHSPMVSIDLTDNNNIVLSKDKYNCCHLL